MTELRPEVWGAIADGVMPLELDELVEMEPGWRPHMIGVSLLEAWDAGVRVAWPRALRVLERQGRIARAQATMTETT
jgi:hypothetical protein